MRTANKKTQGSRGIALITTLLLLSLFTVMTLAMVIATTSDTLIDGYYNNFRGSFYAADSGLNAARQYMINQFNGAIPNNWVPTSGAPISSTVYGTIRSNLVSSSSGFGSYNSTTGSQSSSWPGKFEIDTSTANTYINPPTCNSSYVGTVDPCNIGAGSLSSDTSVSWISYSYPYQITVWGQSRANEQNKIVETGSIVVTVPITISGSTTQSFANYGTFFNSYPICSSPFVTGTMTGPFFSNDSWNFGDTTLVGSGKYIFTDSVGAHSSQVGYMYSDGTCNKSSATSNTHKSTTIAPTFSGGLSLGQSAIPLPQDTYNQLQAVIDGIGACSVSPCPSVPQSTMNANLKNVSGTAYPSTGTPSSGVYLPYTTTSSASCPSPPCFTGGGIYVQGNVDSMTLTASTSGSGSTAHSLQVFTITQGSTTTTVTVDLTGNTTTIASGSSSTTISGVPKNNNTGSEAAMVYVSGNLGDEATSGFHSSTPASGLSGPSSGAAIQDQSQVTITATGNIIVTGSLTYKEEPVTFAASGSTPADQLIAANNKNQVLGLFTPTGDIELQPPSSNQNMEIDASLAMISNGGSGGLIAKWNQINTLTIVGGRIASQAKQGNVNTRNIWFDRRFGQNNFAPPWFPATTITSTSSTTFSTPQVTASRVSWDNTTAE